MSTLREQLRQQQRSVAMFLTAADDDLSLLPLPTLKESTDNQFSDSQRLQIYRNNFSISLRAALTGIYPVIQKLVGEEFFQHAAREYVQRYPSRTGNLHDYGDEFAVFLETFPGLETMSYLRDVARLEWAHHQVFHSVEAGVLSLAALAALDEKQMGTLTFQISSSCVCLASDYPVLHIWQANQSEQEVENVSLDEGGVQFVVLRHGQQIEFHPLSAGVFALVESLSQNKNFSQACDVALEAEADCDIAAALQYLVEQKIVSGFFQQSATLPESEDDNDVD